MFFSPAYDLRNVNLFRPVTLWTRIHHTFLHSRMSVQRRLDLSSLCIPHLDGFVFAAAGNHGSVGAPRNSSDIVRVSSHRAHGIDLLQITIFIKGAGTIRVVFAAKLLKKLILHTLINSIHLFLLGLLCTRGFAGTCARSGSTCKKRILKIKRNRIVQKKNLTSPSDRSGSIRTDPSPHSRS